MAYTQLEISHSSICKPCHPKFKAVKQATRRKRLRTTNMLERQNKEIKRRTRVATLFPNDTALLRLVSAVLIEISEDWETGKRYLTLENDETTDPI